MAATQLQIVSKAKKRTPTPLGTGKRNITNIKSEIKALEACLERARQQFFAASQKIAAKGVSAVKTVTDSRGYAFKATRVSSNVRILEAAAKVERITTKQLTILRTELARLEAPKVIADDTDDFFSESEAGHAE